MAAVSIPLVSNVARPGDHVIVYEGFQKASYIILKPGGVINNRFGAFFHDDFIGAIFGSKVSTRTRGSTGFVHMLPFTPELWTLSLTHRTQILYGIDIAVVCSYLNLRPGCVVIESGTGSGSLTVSLARAVGAGGHVNTFEFNEDRATKAAEDFRLMGMGDRITVRHRDVCGPDGFSPVADSSVDAVFLDLPQPWHALPHAAAALRACGVICSFSPCIEQVQRCCAALAALGFEDIRTFETLLRPYEVQMGAALPPADPLFAAAPGPALAALAAAPPHTATVAAAGPIPEAAEADVPDTALAGSKRRRSLDGAGVAATDETGVPPVLAAVHDAPEQGLKSEHDAEGEAAVAADSATTCPEAVDSTALPSQNQSDSTTQAPPRKQQAPRLRRGPSRPTGILLRPETAIRGHTGYLTFAVLYRKGGLAPKA